MQGKPKKYRYWIPFVCAMFVLINVVMKINDMETPQTGVWSPPDPKLILFIKWYGGIMAGISFAFGLYGLYRYKKVMRLKTNKEGEM
ncbi:hypothetical protein [Gracilibacillus salinarum]|uniref:Uncharacterized protein n=1 Tax=Gracilibacillus salinarum TaxID=2932255 RepID=A0ABY4GSR5_9BACI|nr:hypothetical protein [Gracilibacillus salinarum]UOQ87241.1 hypothetical protein MUN87_10295 [Gracilibacillus salinarum]